MVWFVLKGRDGKTGGEWLFGYFLTPIAYGRPVFFVSESEFYLPSQVERWKPL
jgi:hypothetical protein